MIALLETENRSSDEVKRELLRKAYELATLSRDRSCQNGALLTRPNGQILASGFNDFPTGIHDTEERHERPRKYSFFRHAERAAIYNAAKMGKQTANTVLVCPWFACADCAIAIIESGIVHVIGHQQRMDKTPQRWKDSISDAFTMLREAGVTTELYEGELGASPILVDGELWTP